MALFSRALPVLWCFAVCVIGILGTSLRRVAESSGSWGEEILGAAVPFVLAAALLAMPLVLRPPQWTVRHVVPLATGILVGFLVAGFGEALQWRSAGPLLFTADGEGNAEAALAAYVAVVGFVGLALATPWWPRDSHPIPFVFLVAFTTANMVWLGVLPDTSGPGAWLVPLAAACLVAAWWWLSQPRLARTKKIIVWTVAGLVLAATVGSLFFGSRLHDGVALYPAFAIAAWVVIGLPLVVIAIQAWQIPIQSAARPSRPPPVAG